MKTLIDYIGHENIDTSDKFAPECLLQRSLYMQGKLADKIYARFPLLYHSYYDVEDLKFALNITIQEVWCEEEEKVIDLGYKLITDKEIERLFALHYPEKLI